MGFTYDAACGCNTGKIRKNNEDNFFFAGQCLELVNQGLSSAICSSGTIKKGLVFSVFDGMGGENFGEVASYTAAQEMQSAEKLLFFSFISANKYLSRLTNKLNNAIVCKKRELFTQRCGTTMAALYFSSGYAYVCNLGDSRVYRLQGGKLQQLSVDHVEKRPDGAHRKAPLTQHLGIDPEDMLIEPYIAKHKLRKGDCFLLCSDGITDMLTDPEISDIMLSCEKPADCADKLIQAALEHGGRDNITAILCRIQ